MGHQYHTRDETIKMTKHSRDPHDLRVILSEYILNFEFPRDAYLLLITIVTAYLLLKLFRFSIRLLVSIIRPVIFVILILIILPYLYEMKFGNIASSRMVSNAQSFGQNIVQMLNSVYTHTIQFYAKNFVK